MRGRCGIDEKSMGGSCGGGSKIKMTNKIRRDKIIVEEREGVDK